MKTVMILGGNASEVPVVEASIAMGHRTVVVDRNEDVPSFHVDGVIVERESIADKETVLKLARKYDIDGIIASADAGVRSAAHVARVLNLPGISENAAFMGTNKVAMRRRLKERGVPIPEFHVVKSKKEYLDVIDKGYERVIVKAADASGSRGIYLLSDLTDEAEVNRAYDYSILFSGTGELLVEEVMEGPEICAETLSQDGVCHCVQVSDQLKKHPPFFTDRGYNQPSVLPLDTVERIRQIAIDANMAVENYEGSSCTEMIVTKDGPKVVEIGVRLSGDYLATKMVEFSTGIDVSSEVVKIALGEPIDIVPKIDKWTYSRYFMEEREGEIKDIVGIDDALTIPNIVLAEALKKVGEKAVPLRKSSDRLALVISQADTQEEAIKAADEAVSLIDFIVK